MSKDKEKTPAGSFPEFDLHRGLSARAKKEWQVLCGDKSHWRVGSYSPPQRNATAVKFLEKHTCVELFLLLSGSVTLIIDDGSGEYELPLEPMKPVMVAGWHAGFCPDGAFAGTALVVERDRFSTIYRDRA
jgi:hypothetical protein